MIDQTTRLATRDVEPEPETRGPRRGWFVVAGVFGMLVVLVTGLFLWSWFARQTETQNQTYTHAVGEVDITLSGGDITVLPGATGQVTVQRTLTWSNPKPDIGEAWAGRTLRINSGCWNWRLPGCSVDYVLRVPANVTVNADTQDGSVSVRDISGTLSATSGAGSITATGLRCQRVTAGTRSGAIDLGFIASPERVSATSSSGNISIGVPYQGSYSIAADVRTGQRTVAVHQDAASTRTIDARVDSGDITIQYAGG